MGCHDVLMTDVDGPVLTLESVRAALAADVERDAQTVLAVSNLEREYGGAVERVAELHTQLTEQYALASAKPYIKDKLAELGISDPARLVVTTGGKKAYAAKAPAKKATPKKSNSSPKKTPSAGGAPSPSGQGEDTAPGTGDNSPPEN